MHVRVAIPNWARVTTAVPKSLVLGSLCPTYANDLLGLKSYVNTSIAASEFKIMKSNECPGL